MEEWYEDTIMEKRDKEIMYSAKGRGPFKATTHILRPTVEAFEGKSLKLPSLSPKCKWSLEVNFHGWKIPSQDWKNWIRLMHIKYKSAWKSAGIYEALMASAYKVHRDNELILNLVERWCSETSTFVFPWGEATVTLEDMIVLGGYSVLGNSVSSLLQDEESIKIEEELKITSQSIAKRSFGKKWVEHFMGKENRIEHEAFLSFWLSSFVFPGDCPDRIRVAIFPLAIHLARGTKFALAPAVLASLYRDISLLRETMRWSTNEESVLGVTIWAPFNLLQIWAWERFVLIQPNPNPMKRNDPRVARWHNVKQFNDINIRPALDSSGDSYLWRPYTLDITNWSFPSFYKEDETDVTVDEAMLAFVRCLRVSMIVGLDSREIYQPHRVAMQFGYDQDLPKTIIPSSCVDNKTLFEYYNRRLKKEVDLYFPCRLYRADVTSKYMNWWRKSVLLLVDPYEGMIQRKRSVRKVVKRRNWKKKKQSLDVPPEISPLQRCDKRQRIDDERASSSAEQILQNQGEREVSLGSPILNPNEIEARINRIQRLLENMENKLNDADTVSEKFKLV